MLSSRTKYATRALLDLTLHREEGPILIHAIAERQNIPIKFLEQILLTLKQQGFVESRKGRGGGYFLAKSPSAITLGAVVRALDGPLAPMSCVSVSGYMECGCRDAATCGLKTVWQEARNALSEVLDQTTFADIQQRQLALHGQTFDFYDYVI